MVAISDSLEMAIFAQKILYIGACYCPVSLIMIIFRLCNKKEPLIIKYGFLTLATIIIGFVLTIERNTYYYKKLTLVKGKHYNYFIKEYGSAHILFTALMFLSGLFLITFVIYSIKNRNKMSLLVVSSMSSLGILVIIAYVLERVTHSERFISANTFMKNTFPEIDASWRVDAKVTPSDSYLYTEVVDWLLNNTDSKSHKIIHVNSNHFELSFRPISYNFHKNVGYILEMIDRTDEINYLSKIENYNLNLEQEVELKTQNISHIKDMMVLGMASMVESRDNSTGGHIKRTSKVVEIFARELIKYKDELNITEDFLKLVTKAAPMHDLGKIAISDVILRKKGKFTDEEYAEMKRHSEEGAKIVKNILDGVENNDFVEIATNVAHFHHEKWDGNGYPCRLSGIDIPIEARIMALADVFDALVSKRCYKDAFSYERAYQIITDSLGTHFDPKLGAIFLTCKNELETFYNIESTFEN